MHRYLISDVGAPLQKLGRGLSHSDKFGAIMYLSCIISLWSIEFNATFQQS